MTTPITDTIKTHSFTFLKKEFTGLDLATEAGKLQTKENTLSDSKDVFGQKFMLFAQTCKTSQEFLDLCGSIEARKSWTSKQNPEGTKKAPDVWAQYKSNVKCLWDNFDVSPKGITTVSELNKTLNKKRVAKKEQTDKEEAVKVSSEALSNVINHDSKLGAAMGAITECFDSISADLQGELLEELKTLVTYFTDQASTDSTEDTDSADIDADLAAIEADIEAGEVVQQVVNG